MSKFKMVREKRGDWEVIRLSGIIDAEAGVHFINLYGDAARSCRFNFRDVTAINSYGIRAWVLFLRDFQGEREVELEECPTVIVDQLNMLSSFRGKAKVKSVFINYACVQCNQTTSQLVEAGKFLDYKSGGLKSIRCKSCFSEMKPNEDESYFDFVDEPG